MLQFIKKMKPKNLHQRLRDLRKEKDLDIKINTLTKAYDRISITINPTTPVTTLDVKKDLVAFLESTSKTCLQRYKEEAPTPQEWRKAMLSEPKIKTWQHVIEEYKQNQKEKEKV